MSAWEGAGGIGMSNHYAWGSWALGVWGFGLGLARRAFSPTAQPAVLTPPRRELRWNLVEGSLCTKTSIKGGYGRFFSLNPTEEGVWKPHQEGTRYSIGNPKLQGKCEQHLPLRRFIRTPHIYVSLSLYIYMLCICVCIHKDIHRYNFGIRPSQR